MNTRPTSSSGSCCRDIKRRFGQTIPLVLVLLAVLLTGCGKAVASTWPALSVTEDVVYLAYSQVYALKADTGQLVWSYPAVSQKSGGLLSGCTSSRVTDGPFMAAPTIGEEFVFLSSGGEQQRSLWGSGENLAGLRAMNEFGTLQWKFTGTTGGAIAAPVIAGETIYLASSDHNVYAINTQSQAARWTFKTENWVWATPLVVTGTVYVASMDHTLYAIDDQTGGLKWKFDQPQSALPTSPALADGVLYLAALDGAMYAIDAETGQLKWHQKLDSSLWSTPLVHNNALYLGTLKGTIYALNAADGQTLWKKTVDGEVRSAPAYVDGRLYFGCESGQLYVFDAQDGTESASPLGFKIEKASIYTSPVFNGQYLYVVATDGTVYAIDLEKSAVVWQKNPLKGQEG